MEKEKKQEKTRGEYKIKDKDIIKMIKFTQEIEKNTNKNARN